jgi:geranylgeranyl diphosphate synthase type II
MSVNDRVEAAISGALVLARANPAPARLATAISQAAGPGGARIRPTILLAVASACGEDRPALTDAAAAAIEMIHCASLVHDDLPAFDDAETRRGKPSVHRTHGEALAILAGDSLIVMAFEALARAATTAPERGLALVSILARRTGMPGGICAGQGWESEDEVDLVAYHEAKTAALFVAATQMGAAAAGHDPKPWEELGQRLGLAFQIADDLRDVESLGTGKPAGQDARHGRPSALALWGAEGATRRLEDTLGGAIASIPACPGESALARMVQSYASRMTPASLSSGGTTTLRSFVPGE